MNLWQQTPKRSRKALGRPEQKQRTAACTQNLSSTTALIVITVNQTAARHLLLAASLDLRVLLLSTTACDVRDYHTLSVTGFVER